MHHLPEITLLRLFLAFIPVSIIIFLLFQWSLNWKNALYALSRMLGQLLLIGYFLVYIFASKNFWTVLLVLALMISISSWIALRTAANKRKILYKYVFLSITLGGLTSLLLITQFVLQLHPWYQPRYIIPLGGMIFSNALNAISLAAERLNSELQRGEPFLKARNIAYKASLIPVMNSLFAVGLVAIPGLMTGQILSGTSPLIAARYQIVVMCMIFSSTGLSVVLFLFFTRSHWEKFFSKEQIVS